MQEVLQGAGDHYGLVAALSKPYGVEFLMPLFEPWRQANSPPLAQFWQQRVLPKLLHQQQKDQQAQQAQQALVLQAQQQQQPQHHQQQQPLQAPFLPVNQQQQPPQAQGPTNQQLQHQQQAQFQLPLQDPMLPVNQQQQWWPAPGGMGPLELGVNVESGWGPQQQGQPYPHQQLQQQQQAPAAGQIAAQRNPRQLPAGQQTQRLAAAAQQQQQQAFAPGQLQPSQQLSAGIQQQQQQVSAAAGRAAAAGLGGFMGGAHSLTGGSQAGNIASTLHNSMQQFSGSGYGRAAKFSRPNEPTPGGFSSSNNSLPGLGAIGSIPADVGAAAAGLPGGLDMVHTHRRSSSSGPVLPGAAARGGTAAAAAAAEGPGSAGAIASTYRSSSTGRVRGPTSDPNSGAASAAWLGGAGVDGRGGSDSRSGSSGGGSTRVGSSGFGGGQAGAVAAAGGVRDFAFTCANQPAALHTPLLQLLTDADTSAATSTQLQGMGTFMEGLGMLQFGAVQRFADMPKRLWLKLVGVAASNPAAPAVRGSLEQLRANQTFVVFDNLLKARRGQLQGVDVVRSIPAGGQRAHDPLFLPFTTHINAVQQSTQLWTADNSPGTPATIKQQLEAARGAVLCSMLAAEVAEMPSACEQLLASMNLKLEEQQAAAAGGGGGAPAISMMSATTTGISGLGHRIADM